MDESQRLNRGAIHELEEHQDVISSMDDAKKIAIAHIRERPDYYEMMDIAEQKEPGYYFDNRIVIFNYYYLAIMIMTLIVVIVLIYRAGYIDVTPVVSYICKK